MGPRELRLVITVSDHAGAVAFFRDLLGMPQVASWSDGGGHGVLLDAGAATIEVFDEAQAAAVDRLEAGRRLAGQFRLAVRTEDSAGLARKLEAAGAVILAGPAVTPWGDRNVRLAGPDGIQLTLFEPAAGR